MEMMLVTPGESKIIVGMQWGDEGKGKGVDYICCEMDADVVVRYNGGNNAGHSVWVNGKLIHLHFIPSGVVNQKCLALMAAGELIEPFAFGKELQYVQQVGGIDTTGRIMMDPRMSVIMFYHRVEDMALEIIRKRGEEGEVIGTTAKGVGPAYADLAKRADIRLQDLLGDPSKFSETFRRKLTEKLFYFYNDLGLKKDDDKDIDELRDILKALKKKDEEGCSELIEAGLIDRGVFDYSRYYCPKNGLRADVLIEEYLNAAIELENQVQVCDLAFEVQKLHYAGKNILFEGGQGSLLDVRYGTTPFVTSCHPIAGGACIGTPVGPLFFENSEVIGVGKLFTTRVGNGPFPTESEEFGRIVRGNVGEAGAEYGTTTGRQRRCGYLDMTILRSTAMWSGVNRFLGTKLDVCDSLKEIRICTHYELDGEKLYLMPTKTEELNQVVPVYDTLPGWGEDTTKARSWNDLPLNARRFFNRVMEEIQMPIEGANEVKPWGIGNGPDREQLIKL